MTSTPSDRHVRGLALATVAAVLAVGVLSAVGGPAEASPSRGSGPSTRAEAAQWPVGSRTASLTEHSVTPSSEPARTIVRSDVRQDRATNSYSASVELAAVPTEATAARLIVAFGTVLDDGSCSSPGGGSAFNFPTLGPTDGVSYDGVHVSVRNFHPSSGNARTGAWTCAFTQVVSEDQSVKYDSVRGPLADHVQRPILTVFARPTHLRRGEPTELRVHVHNSQSTVARAPDVRVTWKTHGASVHGQHDIGGIGPGRTRNGYATVRSTQPRATVTLTITSQDYRVTKTLHLRTTR